jgi:polar amino acid transport system substrate-binding protein
MGVLVTLIDITERKSAETQERRREAQMFQAAKMVSLGTLVSGVAHEINNPNNFIRMSAENLQDLWGDAADLLEGIDARTPGLTLKGIPFLDARGMITGMLQGICEGSLRIERLIDTLKDFGRKELGERDEAVDLNVVARSAMKMVESRIKKATSRFSCSLLEGLPRVRGSSHQLEQVVINLLNNALEALTSPEQAVTVSTDWDRKCNTITLTVADEGKGINSEDLDRITDPFFTTKRDTGGTGLGLSVSYQIAKNHGGEIAFLSKTGEGTTARLTLSTGGAFSG